MSITTDTVISATQTLYDKNDDDDSQEIIVVFDENQSSYQILAWHSCQISSDIDRSLTILVRENSWLGTLTSTMENKSLRWKNNLNSRQCQLKLSEQTESIITHFEIQEVNRFNSNRLNDFNLFLVDSFINSLYFIELSYH
jgi:hypothetical protein